MNAQYQPESYGIGNAATTFPVSAFVTHLVYLRGGLVSVDEDRVAVSIIDLWLNGVINLVYSLEARSEVCRNQ